MNQSIRTWFSESRHRWLLIASIAGLFLWIFSCISIFGIARHLCSSGHNGCFDFWLDTMGRPFYLGYFAKSMIIAPLLILPFSPLVFKVWRIFSLIFIPATLMHIVFFASIDAFFDKYAMSNMWGMVYFFATIAIIVTVSIGELIYKKFIKKTPQAPV